MSAVLYSYCLLVWVFICPWQQWIRATRICNIIWGLARIVSATAASGAIITGLHRVFMLSLLVFALLYGHSCCAAKAKQMTKKRRDLDLIFMFLFPLPSLYMVKFSNIIYHMVWCCLLLSEIERKIIWQIYFTHPSLIWWFDSFGKVWHREKCNGEHNMF